MAKGESLDYARPAPGSPCPAVGGCDLANSSLDVRKGISFKKKQIRKDTVSRARPRRKTSCMASLKASRSTGRELSASDPPETPAPGGAWEKRDKPPPLSIAKGSPMYACQFPEMSWC